MAAAAAAANVDEPCNEPESEEEDHDAKDRQQIVDEVPEKRRALPCKRAGAGMW